MSEKKVAAAVAMGVLLSGCLELPPSPPDVREGAVEADTGRITVVQIGVVRDDLAYNNRRGIYIITDKGTGAEYIGVSGIGVSELGSHSTGKATAGDER